MLRSRSAAVYGTVRTTRSLLGLRSRRRRRLGRNTSRRRPRNRTGAKRRKPERRDGAAMPAVLFGGTCAELTPPGRSPRRRFRTRPAAALFRTWIDTDYPGYSGSLPARLKLKRYAMLRATSLIFESRRLPCGACKQTRVQLASSSYQRPTQITTRI